jgi:hypothetical protein
MQNPIGDRLKLARLSTSFTMYIVKFIQATQSTTYISVVRSGFVSKITTCIDLTLKRFTTHNTRATMYVVDCAAKTYVVTFML